MSQTQSSPAVSPDAASMPFTTPYQAHLWIALQDDPHCPSRHVIQVLATRGIALPISLRHVNRLRVGWGMNRGKGRPRRSPVSDEVVEPAPVVSLTPHLSHVGVHLFAAWLDAEGIFGRVVTVLEGVIQDYQRDHPDDAFPLLTHRSTTLLHRFQALFVAPLFGIGKLTDYDVLEHPLATLLGRGYQSSTLTQFVGQLERIDAGPALETVLAPEDIGVLGYVDGHMLAFWTTRSLHKGRMPMLGRIMAGSQAVITHTSTGQAIAVAYYAPDMRLPQLIVTYCHQIVQATGIRVFVIDREVNSVEVARQCESHGLGLLSMLNANQYTGLESWDLTLCGHLSDGSPVYEGTWAVPREDDPREFVVVDTGDRVLAYWGTSPVSAVVPPLQWPEVYQQRTALQEVRFKEMNAHGALKVNYGTKIILGPDRHQQRAREALTQAQARAQQRLEKHTEALAQQDVKVRESLEKGHTTRLDQRQRRKEALHQQVKHDTARTAQIQEQLEAVGAPTTRADRDFRKQLIMTIRTLLLENMLLRFLAALCATLSEPISLNRLLTLVFARSGACVETPSEILYWVSSVGLSVPYTQLLIQILAGIETMNLTCRGKPIRVRLRPTPS